MTEAYSPAVSAPRPLGRDERPNPLSDLGQIFQAGAPSSHSDFWPRWQTILLPCEMQNTRNNPDWIVLGW